MHVLQVSTMSNASPFPCMGVTYPICLSDVPMVFLVLISHSSHSFEQLVCTWVEIPYIR